MWSDTYDHPGGFWSISVFTSFKNVGNWVFINFILAYKCLGMKVCWAWRREKHQASRNISSQCVFVCGYESEQMLDGRGLFQSNLWIHLLVLSDSRRWGWCGETEEQWGGEWPELRLTFHCNNTLLLQSSSERSDRYSEVCQQSGKLTLITHIKYWLFTNGHTLETARF